MTTITVDLGLIGVHRFNVIVNGSDTTVRWISEDPAEVVFHALGHRVREVDETALVLEKLLQAGLDVDEALGWAILEIAPRHPHWMQIWKCPDRPRDLHHVDQWRKLGIGPHDALRSGVCSLRTKILCSAAVVQDTAAHSRAHSVVDATGGQVETSDDPNNAARSEIDDPLNVPS